MAAILLDNRHRTVPGNWSSSADVALKACCPGLHEGLVIPLVQHSVSPQLIKTLCDDCSLWPSEPQAELEV